MEMVKMELSWWELKVRRIIGYELIARLRGLREQLKGIAVEVSLALSTVKQVNAKLDTISGVLPNVAALAQASVDAVKTLTDQVAALTKAGTAPAITPELADAITDALAKASAAADATAQVNAILNPTTPVVGDTPVDPAVPEDPAPPAVTGSLPPTLPLAG